MNESPLKKLLASGQSPWLDFIQRGMLQSGEIKRMIDEWGLRGMTSNPVIFEKAIGHSPEYDGEIAELARNGKTAEQIYEALALGDVRMAADLFRPVYEETAGADGFVSLEVSPHLARNTEATIAEARRLWTALDRPNVMIKVPGTAEGLPAIRTLLSEGTNINITLLFSVPRYRDVLAAFLDGAEARAAAGHRIERLASVASFFLSRIDTLIDQKLDLLAAGNEPRGRHAKALRGETAIACANRAYEVLEECLAQERFRRLRAQGLQVQRLLWASTGTKDPAYSDVKYVEPLIGPNTVNTMPLETLQAFHAHGHPAPRLADDPERSGRVLESLASLGINLDEAAEQLLEEGIDKFVQPYDALLRTLDNARRIALPNEFPASGVPPGDS